MRLTNGPNLVTVMMDYIHELDASGNIIGTSGPNHGKHSRETFASVDFDIFDAVQSNEFDVTSYAVDFFTELMESAKLNVTIHVFNQDGTIHPTANETFAVNAGTIKFSIAIDSWPFCQGESDSSSMGKACASDYGEFLELGVEIKGRDSGDAEQATSTKYTLDPVSGRDPIELEFSTEVMIDGEWFQMPEGYPKVEVQGGKQLFIFRFPRFESSAMYDPLIKFPEERTFFQKIFSCR